MGEGDGEATREGSGGGLDVAPEALAEARLDVLGVCALHAARINRAAARTTPLMRKATTPALGRQLRPDEDPSRAWASTHRQGRRRASRFRPREFGLTADHIFKTPQGGVQLPFMQRSGSFMYAEGRSFQAVSLMYSDRRFRLIVLLPKSNGPLHKTQDLADPRFWLDLDSRIEPREGRLLLPRLSLSSQLSLGEPLANLGLAPALGPGADFSLIPENCQSRCYISDIRHACSLEADESGTTAAAVTTSHLVLAPPPGRGPAPFTMVVDHPFCLALEMEPDGQMLFLAAVSDPDSGRGSN